MLTKKEDDAFMTTIQFHGLTVSALKVDAPQEGER